MLCGAGKCSWQDDGYVLAQFGKRVSVARKHYLEFVHAGIADGRRPELVGGGLVRSLGGWTEVKKMRREGMDRIKGDERILGDSDFVLSVLSLANEQFERRYALKRLGYDMLRVAAMVADIFSIDPGEIFKKGRQKPRPEARALFCYWCSNELGISLTELGRQLEMTDSGVGYAAKRGEKITTESGYGLR